MQLIRPVATSLCLRSMYVQISSGCLNTDAVKIHTHVSSGYIKTVPSNINQNGQWLSQYIRPVTILKLSKKYKPLRPVTILTPLKLRNIHIHSMAISTRSQ